MAGPLLLDEPEALAMLRIGRTLFRSLVRRGEIASVRLGRRRLYPADALAEFVVRLRAEQHATTEARR